MELPKPQDIKNFPSNTPKARIMRIGNNLYVAVLENKVSQSGKVVRSNRTLGKVVNNTFYTMDEYHIMFSRRKSPMDHIRRGFILLMMGYLLSALNGWITMSIGYFMGFPTVSADDVIELVFIVDILHFAGMSFMLIGVLEKLNIPHWGMMVIALVMQAFGYVLAGFCTGNPAVDGFLGLFIKMEFPESAFPLLNWFIFPVAGIVFSDILV